MESDLGSRLNFYAQVFNQHEKEVLNLLRQICWWRPWDEDKERWKLEKQEKSSKFFFFGKLLFLRIKPTWMKSLENAPKKDIYWNAVESTRKS